MPKSNCATFTHFTTSFSFYPTRIAFFNFFVGKIFTVNLPVTLNTNSYSIRYFKPQIRKFTEWFKVMSVYFSTNTTQLTQKIISFKNRLSPFPKIVTDSCTRITNSYATLPRITFFSSSRFSCTRSTAKNLHPSSCLKGFMTKRAFFFWYRISCRPTFFTTKFRCFRSIIMLSVLLVTNRARKTYSFLSANNLFSFNGWHDINHITTKLIKQAYCDIIVDRWKKYMLKSGKQVIIKKNGVLLDG